MEQSIIFKRASALVVAGLTTSLTLSAAFAGGLGIREHSAEFQGMSFAGNAAGGALSSAFWNSAAIGEAGWGVSTDSNYSLILGRTKFSDVELNPPLLPGGGSTDQNGIALVPGSYGAMRISDKLVVGVAVNSPFGLSNKVDDQNWAGQFHHRSSSLLTLNVNPMVSYQIARGLFFGVGVQGQYAKLRFKTAAAADGPNAVLNGDDIAIGFTAGVLWKPSNQTSIGIGYRSAISHNIEGDQFVAGVPGKNKFSLKMDTPETVTVSFRQGVTDRFRFLGSVEWTNWDRLGVHPVTLTNLGNATIANLDFQYSDGWFFSLGGEYDYSDKLTFRAGVAYEISPVDDPTKRLPQVPDADRIWLSAGLTYKINESSTFNFGYTHIFVEDSSLERLPATGGGLVLTADAESSVDIISVGYTMKFGGGRKPLK